MSHEPTITLPREAIETLVQAWDENAIALHYSASNAQWDRIYEALQVLRKAVAHE